MKLRKILSFTLTSVTAGLAAAFVVLVLQPDLLTNGKPHQPSAQPETLQPIIAPPPISRGTSGPVSYADAVNRASPSVVNIFTTKIITEQRNYQFSDPAFQSFFKDQPAAKPRQHRETSLGSGVILDSRGYILTNNHVVEGADEIQLVLHDGRNIPAVVIGTDPDTDLAVLFAHTENLPAISLGHSEQLQVGDVVLAIGNPFGVGQTVTMGIISATGRNRLGINTFEDFIQTDAAINPGNSGGALVNAHGDLVGINTVIFSKTGGSQGIGFAIPVSLAQGIMQQLLMHGRVVRGWLGILAQDITPELAESFGLSEVKGVLVSGVLEQGPADQAGIEPGDVIVEINGIVPSGARDILNTIAMQPPGSVVTINGWRGQQQLKLKTMIIERPTRR
ncbi:Outer membrane stress sensor protease DegS [hydrothermal vent metagenome]|uniref:Outer membrane stress sensor protease DegS n=1 Tax=hydrothermal vent metagenome TaxID=652676 RepID=A0A3B1ALB4_9ZZZZ